MNPKEWKKEWSQMLNVFNIENREPTNEEVKINSAALQFITNLLEAVAVACEGEKKDLPDNVEHTDYELMCERSRAFDEGLDTAANLIRSLKNHE